MNKRPTKKQKRGPLVEGDPFLTAQAFTHKRITKVTNLGRTITEEVLVPLVLQKAGQENTPVDVQDQTDFVGPPEIHSRELNDEQSDQPTGTRRVRDIIGLKFRQLH